MVRFVNSIGIEIHDRPLHGQNEASGFLPAKAMHGSDGMAEIADDLLFRAVNNTKQQPVPGPFTSTD